MQCSIGVYLVAGGKQIRDLCTASLIARHENFILIAANDDLSASRKIR